MIAIAFIGPLRDPVRNIWIIQWGMVCCVAIIPLALIAGSVRGIPLGLTAGIAPAVGSVLNAGRIGVPATTNAMLTAGQKAATLQSAIPPAAQGRVTMSVGVGIDDAGSIRTVVGTSEPGGYLRPGVVIESGEEIAQGLGHAEVSVLTHMAETGVRPIAVGAGRPICSRCAAAIDETGAVPVTSLKEAR